MSERPIDVVSVIGLGYTGLPTAAFIAASGTRVIGVDTEISRVKQINRGELPFTEPGFETLLAQVVKSDLLTAQTNTPKADAYIIAVPTPLDSDYKVDMRYILGAAKQIAAQLDGGELIVLESTSPPGTTEQMAKFVIAERPDLTLDEGEPNSIYFAHAPERVLPGNIMVEMSRNDRVIGGTAQRAAVLARNLYKTFSKGKILITDAATAEMVKLTENTFRDINIAFANELSMICDDLDIDVWELIRLANHHPRVNILQPGPGVGGHCIAVDPWFLVSASPSRAQLIRAARKTNNAKPGYVVDRILRIAEQSGSSEIACLGLSFKGDIGDLRESPAVEIVERLAKSRVFESIYVVEPHVSELPAQLKMAQNVKLVDLDYAISASTSVVTLADHTEFRGIDVATFDKKHVFDARGIFQHAPLVYAGVDKAPPPD